MQNEEKPRTDNWYRAKNLFTILALISVIGGLLFFALRYSYSYSYSYNSCMPSKEQSPLSLPIKLLLPRERVERRIVGGLELFRTQPRQISGIGAAYLYGDRGDTYYTEEAFCFKDQQLQVRSARELDRNGWFALQLHVAGAKEFVRSVMALPGNIRLDAAMQFNPDYEEENPLLATGYFAYEWSYEGSEGRMFFIPPDIHTLADFDFHFGMK